MKTVILPKMIRTVGMFTILCLLSGSLTDCYHAKGMENGTTPIGSEAVPAMETEINGAEEAGLVPDSLIDSLQAGMTYAEVLSLIGFEGPDVGSGALIQQYNTQSGSRLFIRYIPPYNAGQSYGKEAWVIDKVWSEPPTGTETPSSPGEENDETEDPPLIPDSLVSVLHEGMFLEDVVAVIGYESEDVGSGTVVHRYVTESNQVLLISYGIAPGYKYTGTTEYHRWVVQTIILEPASD